MRLDKFLSSQTSLSRSDVKKEIKKGNVTVNGIIAKSPETKIEESSDRILLNNKEITYSEHVYYLLNKPQGVISSTEDSNKKTVIDLIKKEDRRLGLHPVGRLDIDTEGLLIITNDGAFSHNMLSPSKHVNKTYYAKLKGIPNSDSITAFKKGIDIGTMEAPEICKPANLELISTDKNNNTCEVRITISEGKYHQVKRMAHAIGCEVTYLKRLSMGDFTLPNNLELGKYIKLYIS